MSTRLKSTVQQAGGLAAVAVKSGISRAQLGRYLQGSPIPSDKLLSLAAALRVSIGWLLGEEDATRERFGASFERTRSYAERLGRLLQRLDISRALQPPEFGRLLELILLSQHYIVEAGGEEVPLNDYDLEYGIHYIDGIRRNDWLDVYVDGCKYIVEKGVNSLESYWANKWAMIVQEAFKAHYSKEPLITDYYMRLNVIKLPPTTAHFAMMERWVTFLLQNLQGKAKVDVLDAGCGNGRHLLHLQQTGDRFNLKGVDTSPAALAICHDHQKMHRLPANCVIEGDFFNLPFPDESFDAYMSITNLQFIPLLQGSVDIGVGRAMHEAWRVLRPGGYAMLLVQSSAVPSEFFPMFQFFHPAEALHNILKQTGFKIIKQAPLQLAEPEQPGARYGRGIKHQDIWIIQKV